MKYPRFGHASWYEVGSSIFILVCAFVYGFSIIGEGVDFLLIAFLIFALSALSLSHLLIRHRIARVLLLSVAISAFSLSAILAFNEKDIVLALLFAFWALGLFVSDGVLSLDILVSRNTAEVEQKAIEDDDKQPDLTSVVVGSMLFVIGLSIAGAGMWPSWFMHYDSHLMFWGGVPAIAALGFVFSGAGLIIFEVLQTSRWKRIVMRSVSAGALLILGMARLFGDSALCAAPLILVALLLIGSIFASAVFIEPRGMEMATPKELEVYEYDRSGRFIAWIIVGMVGLLASLADALNIPIVLAGISAATVIGILRQNLSHIHRITVRNYLFTLIVLTTIFNVIWFSDGGIESPLTFIAFVIVMASAVVIRSRWTILFTLFVWCIPVLEIYATFQRHQHDIFTLASFSSMLFIVALYAYILSRRRERFTTELEGVQVAMQASLKQEADLREQYRSKATHFKSLNSELVEMRSALLNVLEDVEQSKRSIEIERRREAAIFAALDSAVVAADMRGRIILVNKMAETTLNLTREKLIGKQMDDVLKFFVGDDVIEGKSVFVSALAGKSAKLIENLYLLGPDGQHIPIAGSVAPFRDDRDVLAGVVIALRDVTIEREINQQKSSFVTIASHQLRTPINAIRWYIDLLLEGDAGKLTGQQKEFLSDISTSVIRIARLIDDLLHVSRAEEGRIKFKLEPVDAKKVVEDILVEIRPLAMAKKQALEIDVDAHLPTIISDGIGVREVVENLLSNSVKYTPEGGKIGVRVGEVTDGIRFEIWDTGYGIPKEQQHHVFEKFYRGKRALSMETQGTGLGLYIAKKTIESCGGALGFESKEGEGSRFFFTLPISDKREPS